MTLSCPPRPQVRVICCNPSLFRFSIDHYDGNGKEWATVFKTVMLRRSAAAGNSQAFVPRAVLGLSSHSSRPADQGQAVGFRPAAIRGRARRTPLVRRSKLIQSPTSLPSFIAPEHCLQQDTEHDVQEAAETDIWRSQTTDRG